MSDPFNRDEALRFGRGVGRVCAAGQHAACCAVGDPWDDDAQMSRTVWVCSCDCHSYPLPGAPLAGEPR